MGQELSKHKVFVKQLKEALKTRGVKVKSNDLFKFFDLIKDTCPWFSQEGSINIRSWNRVGDALGDFHRTFGPDKVPITAFAYWSLIKELLEHTTNNSDIAAAVTQTEDILKAASKQDLQGEPSEEKGEVDLISLESEDEEVTSPFPDAGSTDVKKKTQHQNEAPPKIYPSLTRFKDPSNENKIDDEEVDLDLINEEASKYHNPDCPLKQGQSVFSYPHPYRTPSAPMAMAVIDPKEDLKEKIKHLEEQINLEEQYQALITRSQKLKTGNESVPCPDGFKRDIRPQILSGQQCPRGGVPLINRDLKPPPLSAFPVTETRDNQGQPWRHHTGFDFTIIKELKTAVSQYGATAPYTF